jgi:hypothetical protein
MVCRRSDAVGAIPAIAPTPGRMLARERGASRCRSWPIAVRCWLWTPVRKRGAYVPSSTAFVDRSAIETRSTPAQNALSPRASVRWSIASETPSSPHLEGAGSKGRDRVAPTGAISSRGSTWLLLGRSDRPLRRWPPGSARSLRREAVGECRAGRMVAVSGEKRWPRTGRKRGHGWPPVVCQAVLMVQWLWSFSRL